ncbi:hypothetical protein [Clostridium estertheticum]|uniref:hypothetical protein n=1 Tax=Clostridium estertheticum TaxID=238834 RepID=UPI001C6F5D24|nr:hypothetical protein [Clostridium estertheticum]MBW9154769.1 hypothetical protein [Clostridium estertheticum]WLC83447.1 hypothetical protein KTC97_15340 [Clostridium estertheticum]
MKKKYSIIYIIVSRKKINCIYVTFSYPVTTPNAFILFISRYIKAKDIIAVKKSDNGTDTKIPVTLKNIGIISINGIKNKHGFIIDMPDWTDDLLDE